ncbi:MAG: EAL domain-containing protein [Alphaproteobacteria bacterium]|nr:GGDEF-domain containing protein [Hyphomonas sp.]MBR9808134.1 EAL domain-containing protein [Alphaproteobacteria bacterium]
MPHRVKEKIEAAQRRARRDAVILTVSAILLFIAAVVTEAFEYVVNFSDTHESWEIDEMLVVMMIMPLAMLIFMVRRAQEMRQEINARKEAEKATERIALHDPLTGLANRRKGMSHLKKLLKNASTTPVTIVGVDLNRFKGVNDLHGHNAGDLLLVAVSERLVDLVGDLGMVCRMGGDEFVVILKGSAYHPPISDVINQLPGIFNAPFELEHVVCSVGASIGVSQTDDEHLGEEGLLSRADVAMYRDKNKGGVSISFYEPGMEEAAKRRAMIESELRSAIIDDRMEPYFQPIIDLETGEVIGFEALARCRASDGNLLMPEEFIPIAEQSGLISRLFLQILRKGCLVLRLKPPHMTMAINLSSLQLNDDWLAEQILATLTETGVAPGRLEVEITETALVANFEAAHAMVMKLKSQGIRISLDDFGTGYSSLRHLSELPFDKLKIDKSFVVRLGNDEASDTIVRTVTTLAHNLGLKVTAEGIEDDAHVSFLKGIGCEYGQGFLYGRPVETSHRRVTEDAANEDHEEVEAFPTSTRGIA